MRLSEEQKAYLKTIEKKKNRKKTKKEILILNRILGIDSYEFNRSKKFFGEDISKNFNSLSKNLKSIKKPNTNFEYYLLKDGRKLKVNDPFNFVLKEDPTKENVFFTIDEHTTFTKEMLESFLIK